MGKVAPNEMIDAALDYVAGSNYYTVCSGSPATYADAKATLILAGIGITSACFTKADDTSGRKLTMTAKTSASITASGSALAVCLIDTGGSTLRYVTI